MFVLPIKREWLFIVVAFALGWYALTQLFHIPVFILPTPYQVLKVFADEFVLLATHSGITIVEILVGWFCAAVIGFGLAISIISRPSLMRWCEPFLLISQAFPIFAIAPLLVLWFGYGVVCKILTVILMLIFPIVASFLEGLKRTPKHWLELGNTLRGTSWTLLRHIKIPAALPSFAIGLRVATAYAPMAAVISEWVGSTRGLGFLILNANARVQIDHMFAAILMLVVLTLVFYFSVDKLLRRWIYWQTEQKCF